VRFAASAPVFVVGGRGYNMDSAGLFWVKRFAIAISIAWIAGIGWVQFSEAINDFGVSSRTYQRGSSECEGSYKSRYDCKSQILISGENDAFMSWLLKFAIVFLPPIGVGFLFGAIRRRYESDVAEAARRRALRRRTPPQDGQDTQDAQDAQDAQGAPNVQNASGS